jgi:hypothetical protein
MKIIALLMEAESIFETSVYFSETTGHYMPETCIFSLFIFTTGLILIGPQQQGSYAA